MGSPTSLTPHLPGLCKLELAPGSKCPISVTSRGQSSLGGLPPDFFSGDDKKLLVFLLNSQQRLQLPKHMASFLPLGVPSLLLAFQVVASCSRGTWKWRFFARVSAASRARPERKQVLDQTVVCFVFVSGCLNSLTDFLDFTFFGGKQQVQTLSGPSTQELRFHLLKNPFYFPLLLLKGIYHYWIFKGCRPVPPTPPLGASPGFFLFWQRLLAGSGLLACWLARSLDCLLVFSAFPGRARLPTQRAPTKGALHGK